MLYMATYKLKKENEKDRLCVLKEKFSFKRLEITEKIEKDDEGYFCILKFEDGRTAIDRFSNNMIINISHIVPVMNVRYFDRELSENELNDVKKQMREECLKALQQKVDWM